MHIETYEVSMRRRERSAFGLVLTSMDSYVVVLMSKLRASHVGGTGKQGVLVRQTEDEVIVQDQCPGSRSRARELR